MDLKAEMAGPFGSDYQRSSPRTIVPTPVSRFSDLLHQYTELLESPHKPSSWISQPAEMYAQHLRLITTVLSAADLQEFLKRTTTFEVHPNYCWATGFVMTTLIQNSHNHGLNTIFLNVEDIKPLDWLFVKLKQKAGQTLHVMVYGTIGDECNSHSVEGTYYLERVGKECFSHTTSTIYVRDAQNSIAFKGRGTFYSDNLQLIKRIGQSNSTKCTWTPTSSFDFLWKEAEKQYFGGSR